MSQVSAATLQLDQLPEPARPVRRRVQNRPPKLSRKEYPSDRGPRRVRPISAVVPLLQAEQRRSGLTDAQWARQCLGVSPPQWLKLRNGTTSVGPDLLVLMLRNFPHLRDQLIDALISSPASRNGQRKGHG